MSRVFEQLYNSQLWQTVNFKLDFFQAKKQDYETNKKLRNMNEKNKHFIVFNQQLVFSNKHKICSGQELLWLKSPLLYTQDDQQPNKSFQNEWQETETQTKTRN